MSKQVDEVMKDESGKLWVKWKGSKKFYLIPDDEIACYLVYLIVNKDSAVNNINSKLR